MSLHWWRKTIVAGGQWRSYVLEMLSGLHLFHLLLDETCPYPKDVNAFIFFFSFYVFDLNLYHRKKQTDACQKEN